MTMSSAPPAHLEAYVRLLGLEGAIAFLLAYGGGELFLPQRAAAPLHLVEVVGPEAAARLCQAAARLPKRVPTAKPWLAAALKARGLSVTEIARKLHASDVSVRRWLDAGGASRRAPPDYRQSLLL